MIDPADSGPWPMGSKRSEQKKTQYKKILGQRSFAN
jgi:hypothetical protein